MDTSAEPMNRTPPSTPPPPADDDTNDDRVQAAATATSNAPTLADLAALPLLPSDSIDDDDDFWAARSPPAAAAAAAAASAAPAMTRGEAKAPTPAVTQAAATAAAAAPTALAELLAPHAGRAPPLPAGCAYHFYLVKHERYKYQAKDVAAALRDLGFKIWLSQWEGEAGRDVDEPAMQRGVRASAAILLLLTPGLFQAARVWCTHTELKYAVDLRPNTCRGPDPGRTLCTPVPARTRPALGTCPFRTARSRKWMGWWGWARGTVQRSVRETGRRGRRRDNR